jgi:hypothetical protein
VLGLVYVAALIAIWQWRKWGAYVVGINALAMMALSLAWSVATSVGVSSAVLAAGVGLIAPGLVVGFAAAQWRDFE